MARALIACGVLTGCGGGGGEGTGGSTTPPACGDGKVDPGEACDDGNTTAGDGCDSSCAEVVEGDASKTCESNGIDSYLTLHSSMGTSLVTDDDGRGYCSAIDGTGVSPRDSAAHNLAAGTYYLEVKRSSLYTAPADVFNYKLAVTIRQ